MGKAAGVVTVMFMLGGGAVTLLSSLLGAHAEAAALALVGAGMLATGQILGATRGATAASREEVIS